MLLMKRVALFLILLLPLLVPAMVSGQASGLRPSQLPRRVWPRDRLAVRVAAAVKPAPAEPDRADGEVRLGENLRWRNAGERDERLAQLPPAPYAPLPTQPYGPPPGPGAFAQGMLPPFGPHGMAPQAPHPGARYPGAASPGALFPGAGPPAWTAPGYWAPNPMLPPPGDPDCPPYYGWPYPYGCPPGAAQPPLMPVPPPGPLPTQPPAAEAEPQYSNVPLLPPNIIGSLFGAQPQLLRLTFDNQFPTRGTIISGSPGSPGAVLAYERNGGFPNDFSSVPGTGRDVSGDGLTDTFSMTEPVPPNEVPTSPGPGYQYDGGTVSYTNSPTLTTAQNGQFQDNEFWYAQYSFSKSLTIPAAGAQSLRPMYVAQNNSPLPRDRFFFDGRYFQQARPDLGDVTWATFGMEKTFHSNLGSLEARLPFANTIDSEVFEDDAVFKSTELGNITFTLKHVIWGNERWLISGGAGVSLPTGANTRVFLADGTEVLNIDNNSVHIQPFIAALWLPEEHFFVETFVATDLETRGSDVNANIQGGRLPTIGNYRSASTLIVDLASGYWIYTNPSFRAAMQGLALVGELQYQTTLENADSVSGNGITLSGTPADINAYSATLGLHAYLFNQLSISGGAGIPISSTNKQEYDLAVMLMANWHF